jgi:hypothetical protein
VGPIGRSFIEIYKLNAVHPHACLTDTLGKWVNLAGVAY